MTSPGDKPDLPRRRTSRLQREIESVTGETKGRRGFLGAIGRVGLSTVAAAAGIQALSKPSSAKAKVAAYQYACCGTALPPFSCGGNYDTCSFPCSHYKRCWSCSSGAYCYMCCECQSSSGGCFSGGTYYCSQVCDGGCGSPRRKQKSPAEAERAGQGSGGTGTVEGSGSQSR